MAVDPLTDEEIIAFRKSQAGPKIPWEKIGAWLMRALVAAAAAYAATSADSARHSSNQAAVNSNQSIMAADAATAQAVENHKVAREIQQDVKPVRDKVAPKKSAP